jgi:hypothetical protein
LRTMKIHVLKTYTKIFNKKFLYQKASLTVEASLVMPIFLYLMIAFLYFMQIFTIQEQIQSTITKMGLGLSKSAYFYKDFPDINEAVSFDKSILDSEYVSGINEMTDKIISGYSLKLFAKQYLDKDFINQSCVKNGFDGIDFSYSSIANEDDVIDIIVKYQICIPVRIINLGDMSMLQRVRLRAWTGYEVVAAYEIGEDSDEEMVYVTDTGTVYHKSKDCSHIKLSVTSVVGIPIGLRNANGAKYSRCEECCSGEEGENATYYITSYGTRYHADRNCSGIKRSVHEIPISEVGNRTPCSRCGK